MSGTNKVPNVRTGLKIDAAIAAILGGVATVPAAIAAEPAEGGLEEVVVTATRREESLQNVPLAVSAVTADALEKRNIQSIADLKPGTIPGLFVTTFSGTPTVPVITMRGVGLSDPTQGTVEMTTPVYIDGVFLGRAQGLGLELIEPERIEVLRGPQGQLFGRNAEGGVVQFVTRKPSGEFGARVSAAVGNFGERRFKASVDLPSAGGFAVQVSGVKSEHDAYTKVFGGTQTYVAPAPQTPYNQSDTTGGRVAVRWTNESNFIADYSYDQSDSNDSQAYLTWVPVATNVNPLTPQTNVPSSTEFPETTFNRQYNPDFKVKAAGHALTLAYEANEHITLKSISSYREASRRGGSNLGAPLIAGVTATGFTASVAVENISQHQWSQELQFIGSWDAFDLTAGGVYYKENVVDQRISQLTGPGLAGFALFPTLCQRIDPCQVGDNRQRAESKSAGLYAQATWRASDKLSLIAGARYSDDKKTGLRFFSFASGGAVNQPASFKASRVDPAFTVQYKFSDSSNIYARAARGYRAGGANVRSSTFASFNEEENDSLELGFKTRLANNRLQLNAAIFQNTIKGEQLTIQEQPLTNPSLTNTVNSGADKKVKGAEVELTWAATDSLTLGANYTYMDAIKFKDIDNQLTAAVDLTRFYTVLTPENSGSLFLDFNTALPIGKLAFHTDYAFASEYWTTPGAQLVAGFQATYVRPATKTEQLGARLAWTDIPLGKSSVELALYGRNLTDDSNYVYGFDGCALGRGFCTFRTPPRTYGAEVKFNF